MRRLLAIVIALAGLALSAAPAQAGTFGPQFGQLQFVANPGERNDVSVSGDGSRSLLAEDRGARLTPGAGCRAVDVHRVSCPAGPQPFVVVFLGNRDDRLRGGIPSGAVEGGAGDDVLLGGRGDDSFIGGDGDDALSGGPGSDFLSGDDLAGGDAPGDDVLDGGPGSDGLVGGPGRDRLFGRAGDDVLDGDFSPAADDLRGPRPRRAPDRIRGGGGTDHLEYSFVPLSPGRPRPAPPLVISFDGRPNDGPRREGDNVASGVERAYSLSTAGLVRARHGFRVERVVGPRGPLKGRLGARIYRLGRRGTRGAQNGLFEGAEFALRNRRRLDAPVELDLRGGSFDRCPNRTGAEAARRRPGALIRRLLARVRGLFRVNARYVSLTVHGTAFTIAERCSETRIRVTDGVVEIRSHGRRRLLRKGQTFTARAP